MSKKGQVLEVLLNHCKESGNFVFHNDLVKDVCKQVGFGNPFDVCKLDNSDKLPQAMKDEDYFVVHLGEGYHQFIKGIANAFHRFEAVRDRCEWNYNKSILNELNTSESNILSLGFNQKLIHDFLYDDIAPTPPPKVYGPHRTKVSATYFVGGVRVDVNKLQIEIDCTVEKDGYVAIFEAKNGFPSDFAVYQIFLPQLYYHLMKADKALAIKQVHCCYLLRMKDGSQSVVRLYQYQFSQSDDMSSVELVKSKEYHLIGE